MRTLYESILDTERNIESKANTTLESYGFFKEFVVGLKNDLDIKKLEFNHEEATLIGIKTKLPKFNIEHEMHAIGDRFAKQKNIRLKRSDKNFMYFSKTLLKKPFMSVEYIIFGSYPVDKIILKFTPLS